MRKHIEFISEHLPVEERLCALAEEASELAQAALKLRRVYDQTSPTVTPYKEVIDNLYEEIADVNVCVRALGLDSKHHVKIYQEKAAYKLQRWVERISKRAGN